MLITCKSKYISFYTCSRAIIEIKMYRTFQVCKKTASFKVKFGVHVPNVVILNAVDILDF